MHCFCVFEEQTKAVDLSSSAAIQTRSQKATTQAWSRQMGHRRRQTGRRSYRPTSRSSRHVPGTTWAMDLAFRAERRRHSWHLRDVSVVVVTRTLIARRQRDVTTSRILTKVRYRPTSRSTYTDSNCLIRQLCKKLLVIVILFRFIILLTC